MILGSLHVWDAFQAVTLLWVTGRPDFFETFEAAHRVGSASGRQLHGVGQSDPPEPHSDSELTTEYRGGPGGADIPPGSSRWANERDGAASPVRASRPSAQMSGRRGRRRQPAG